MAEGKELGLAIAEMHDHFDKLTVSQHQKYQGLKDSIDEIKLILNGREKPVVDNPEQSGTNFKPHSMKLDLPRFDGTDAQGWIFRNQEYFEFYETPDAQRLRIAAFNMEGKASEWYQWLKTNKKLSTWQNFLQQVKERFGPSEFEDYTGQLAKLMQKGTVAEYQSEFESLMNKVNDMSEAVLLSIFIVDCGRMCKEN